MYRVRAPTRWQSSLALLARFTKALASREHVALRLQNFAVNIVEAQFINSLADQDGNETTLAKVLAASTFLGPAPGQAP
jgi:hypothetical protein